MVRRCATVATLLLVGLATAAQAEREDPSRWPQRTTALHLTTTARYLGDRSVGGVGLGAEVAWGWGRWQALADARAGWAFADGGGGPMVRAGGGVRWLARSFQPDSSAALQLYLDAGAGIEHLALAGGGLTVPSVWGGWGWQVRAGGTHRRLMFRFILRIEIAPAVDRDRVARVLCRGACTAMVTSAPFDEAFSGGLGVAW
ncbi:MAG: hypothetical protein R3B06_16285 [Kofleriaceae bacterium]